MTRCRHENVNPYAWRESIAVGWGWFLARMFEVPGCKRCLDCGAWLPLGPSDETDPRVAVEIESAGLAQSWHEGNHKPGYDRFDWCPDRPNGDELCCLCDTRYLAHCITNHTRSEEGE